MAARGLAAGAMLCAWQILPGAAASEPYRLNAQDRLLIRVLTWDYQLNAPTAWQGLSGEYTIGADGELQLPLAGTLQAEGMTQSALRQEIANLLRLRAGLDDPPQLSVELVESRPIYVLGDVTVQGAVPFRPGLTARQAMALAGGLFRGALARGPAQIIALTGEQAAAEQALQALLTEQARIQQELTDLAQPPGAEPATAPAPSAPNDSAQSRLQYADRVARQVRIDSYASLRTMLEEKGQRLNQQLQLRDQQIASTREELAGITELNEKGLAVKARVTSLETALTDLETKRLELETALLLLDTQLNQARLDSDTITTDAVAMRLRRLTELDAEIPATRIRAETARQLLQTEMAYAAGDAPARPQPDFTLTRNGESARIDPDAPLRPGDTLEVLLPHAAPPGGTTN